MHERVHKTDLQPISTVTEDQVAVDEKMIRISGNKHRLYGVVEPRNGRDHPARSVAVHDETDNVVVSRRVTPTMLAR
jgi:hypothetical protein